MTAGPDESPGPRTGQSGGRQVAAAIVCILMGLLWLWLVVGNSLVDGYWGVAVLFDGDIWAYHPLLGLGIWASFLVRVGLAVLLVPGVLALCTRSTGPLKFASWLAVGLIVLRLVSLVLMWFAGWGLQVGLWGDAANVVLVGVLLALFPWVPGRPPATVEAEAAQAAMGSDHFHVAMASGVHGPYPLSYLPQFIAEGRIPPDAHVSFASGAWIPAPQVPGYVPPSSVRPETQP